MYSTLAWMNLAKVETYWHLEDPFVGSDALFTKTNAWKKTGFVLVLNKNKTGLFLVIKTETNQINIVFDNEN